ncbi:helix-turn-helix transcriptional regulator [Georgenia deserti]|uniref:Helix-turn-helix transcriptional regulator n=1 Tax=Georgenia deserti TaxID=2093781 RepID=A0ABW4L627_9MICO
MIDRAGLADFLRRRRETLRPSDVGLPAGARRRTPGLRREEVAQLAGVSTDHYTRLERARGSAPSQSVVASIARALRCDLDERDHLFHLTGFPPPPRIAGGHVRPGLIALATRLGEIPVSICSDLGEILWSNTLFETLSGLGETRENRAQNLIWRWFTDPPTTRLFPREDWARLSAAHVSDLRATYARRGADEDVAALVRDLLAASVEFRELWDRHEVAVRREDRKDIQHPELGLICLRCEVLRTPEEDVQMLAFFPVEGTDAAEKLALLQVIGTQDFTAAR